jgi:hypothetical protein
MKDYMKVEGHPSLVRDKNSGVVLNINNSEIKEARKRKKAWKEQQEELDSLKSEMKEMKLLLNKILEATNG